MSRQNKKNDEKRKVFPVGNSFNKTPKQILIDTKNLISDIDKWCQGSYEMDGGTKHCVIGALICSNCPGESTGIARDTLYNSSIVMFGRVPTLVNDEKPREQAHVNVIKMLDMAIANFPEEIL